MNDIGTASALKVGWAAVNITPDKPAQMFGQFYERVSQYVRDPITATALALETGDGSADGDQAVLVSCDLVVIPRVVQERVRERVAGRVRDLDARKLFIFATHTHSAPTMKDDMYPPPGAGVIHPHEYADLLVGWLSQVIEEAWSRRAPGGVSWGLGRAAVGYCRRVLYDDGTARMYGSSDSPHFIGEEGSQDHGVEMLFFWDPQDRLTGVVINVACPSQVVEGSNYMSADFWSAARRRLRETYGEHVFVLPQAGTAGDQSPRDLVRRDRGEPSFRAEEGLEEMGRRIASAVDEVYDSARSSIRREVVLRHAVEELALPMWKVSEAERDKAQANYADLAAKNPHPDPNSAQAGVMRRLRERVVQRYERQGDHPEYSMELHVLRLGDVALATNPFELFLDYGFRIKARSKALQTVLIQLACDHGRYLPTARAVAGGHYGAQVSDCNVGPEGGQVLVERTVELVNSMWPADKA